MIIRDGSNKNCMHHLKTLISMEYKTKFEILKIYIKFYSTTLTFCEVPCLWRCTEMSLIFLFLSSLFPVSAPQAVFHFQL